MLRFAFRPIPLALLTAAAITVGLQVGTHPRPLRVIALPESPRGMSMSSDVIDLPKSKVVLRISDRGLWSSIIFGGTWVDRIVDLETGTVSPPLIHVGYTDLMRWLPDGKLWSLDHMYDTDKSKLSPGRLQSYDGRTYGTCFLPER